MAKYVAKRKDVCAGELLKPMDITFKIFDGNNNEVNEEQLADYGITNFHAFGGEVCRGMLVRNEDGLARDLIWTTPTKYPIDGIANKADIESDFIIHQYVELEELLKYLNYGVDLTQSDLNQIYRTLIIREKWLKHNMELFGWKKTEIGYTSGGIQTLPMNIYDNLSSISCSKNGKPHKEEPGYARIKRRSLF